MTENKILKPIVDTALKIHVKMDLAFSPLRLCVSA
jgi:hypothetical protein